MSCFSAASALRRQPKTAEIKWSISESDIRKYGKSLYSQPPNAVLTPLRQRKLSPSPPPLSANFFDFAEKPKENPEIREDSRKNPPRLAAVPHVDPASLNDEYSF